jgi:hypothetical protein
VTWDEPRAISEDQSEIDIDEEYLAQVLEQE